MFVFPALIIPSAMWISCSFASSCACTSPLTTPRRWQAGELYAEAGWGGVAAFGLLRAANYAMTAKVRSEEGESGQEGQMRSGRRREDRRRQ